MNGRTSRSEAPATSAATSVSRAVPIAASQTPSGQRKNLMAPARPTASPGAKRDVAVAPGERDEHAEERRQVRDADLADHRRPQRKRAVHAPVAHADDAQREHAAREPDERDRPSPPRRGRATVNGATRNAATGGQMRLCPYSSGASGPGNGFSQSSRSFASGYSSLWKSAASEPVELRGREHRDRDHDRQHAEEQRSRGFGGRRLIIVLRSAGVGARRSARPSLGRGAARRGRSSRRRARGRRPSATARR